MSSRFPRSYSRLSGNSTGLCKNCSIRPKFQNYDYCGKTCAAEAETRRNPAAQASSAQGPPTSMAMQSQFFYSATPGPNTSAASNMCENCRLRVKSQEPDEDGTVITHLYCGIRCYQASQQTLWPASTIPAPAAAFAGREPLKLWPERTNTLMGRQISLMMQERWKSDKLDIPKLKAIYRIDTPGQVSRRFDLALQMNDGCPVTTTYYGAIATCSIADDTDPVPCASESCDLCDALRSSFGNLLYGVSCSDGAYGPGLYTYSNPALAYPATVPDNNLKAQGFGCALIQCRVVTKADSAPSPNSYAGFIDDSGVVFCAQATAIIPTHLLICNKTVPPKASQHAIPVSTNSVSLGRAPAIATPIAGGIGKQVDASDIRETKPNAVKGSKGKARAQAEVPLQKPRGKGTGAVSSSKQHPGVDVTDSELPEYPPSFTSTQGIHQPSTVSAIRGPPKPDSTIVRKERDNSANQVVSPSPLNAPQPRGSNADQSVAVQEVNPLGDSSARTNSLTDSLRRAFSGIGVAFTGVASSPDQSSSAALSSRSTIAKRDPDAMDIDQIVEDIPPIQFRRGTTSESGPPAPPPLPPLPPGSQRGLPSTPAPVPSVVDLVPAPRVYSAALTSAQVSPPSALNQGLLCKSTPAPDPATAALRAMINPDPRAPLVAPPPPPSLPPHVQRGLPPTPASAPAHTAAYPVPVYSPTPASAQLSPPRAKNQGLFATPAPDPATAALRAMINPDSRGSLPSPPAQPPHAYARIDDDNVMDYFNNKKGKAPVPRKGRPASTLMDQVAGGPQKAMRQSYYTWTGHADPDDEPRSSVAAAHKYVKRSRDLESRMDEDEDDLDLLKPDPNLVKRQELQEGFDEDDEDYFDDLPDHPPKIK